MIINSFKNSIFFLLLVFRKQAWKITSLVNMGIEFIRRNFTWLSVLVIGVVGIIILVFRSWSCRYMYFNWSAWKGRAFYRCMAYMAVLVAFKILIGGVKK